MNQQATYYPEVFNPVSIPDARKIILTSEDDLTTDERWELETPYLIELMEKNYNFHSKSVVLDFGCGIGRLSKPLLTKYPGMRIVGVDFAPNMRALGAYNCQNNDFCIIAPGMLDLFEETFDYVIGVWIFQHLLYPKIDIEMIHKAMKPGAKLFAVNNHHRSIPTRENDWVNDEISIKNLLDETFPGTEPSFEKLDARIVSNLISRMSFCGVWTKNAE